MMPRPRSRKNPVEVVDVEELAEEVRELCRNGPDPVAILTGPREWSMVKRQHAYRELVRFWPGGEETLLGVPVIIRQGSGAPRVMPTQADVEEALGA